MNKPSGESKVKQLLTNKKLAMLKQYLGRDHSIDCLFILYLNCGKWGEAKSFAKQVGFSLSFSAYRSRMRELENLGIATSRQIDPIKKQYVLTDYGKKLTKALLTVFDAVASRT